MKGSTAALALGATLVLGGGSALASSGVPHVFGNGGKQYQFDAQCHRITFVPPGISNGEAINVLGQQVRCLVRRKQDQNTCLVGLGPVPPVKIVKKDDWVGVDDLRDYVAGLKGCLA